MKLQHFTVIFIIIILPISFLISSYTDSRIEEINIQNQYKIKIEEACFDAIKTFEINTKTNEKRNFKNTEDEVKYMIETFYKSLANQFLVNGYSSKDLKNYTPAIVVNLYDGFYMYSKYKDAKNDKYLYGLRPYEKYSCRYVYNDDYDFIVNYTLDNYIEVSGLVKGKIVNQSGYLIDIRKIDNNSKQKIDSSEEINELYYDDLKIQSENIINYTIENEDSKIKEQIKKEESKSALKYYEESYKFTKWVQENLSDISPKNAINGITGEKIEFNVNQSIENNKIFSINDSNIPEERSSTFFMHKESIIRKKIEDSLKSAIACFNEFSTTNYEFVLPKINEGDLENIANKVNIMAFVQGLSIKGKYSNSYAIVSSNINNEIINNEDLYALSSDGNYHKLNCKELIDTAIKDDNFLVTLCKKNSLKRKKVEAQDKSYYYYEKIFNDEKKNYEQCYKCIVNIPEIYLLDDIIKGEIKDESGKIIYGKDELKEIRRVYFTSIAREKYNLKNTD